MLTLTKHNRRTAWILPSCPCLFPHTMELCLYFNSPPRPNLFFYLGPHCCVAGQSSHWLRNGGEKVLVWAWVLSGWEATSTFTAHTNWHYCKELRNWTFIIESNLCLSLPIYKMKSLAKWYSILILILSSSPSFGERRKMWFWKDKWLIQGHRASKKNPGLCDSLSMFLGLCWWSVMWPQRQNLGWSLGCNQSIPRHQLTHQFIQHTRNLELSWELEQKDKSLPRRWWRMWIQTQITNKRLGIPSRHPGEVTAVSSHWVVLG